MFTLRRRSRRAGGQNREGWSSPDAIGTDGWRRLVLAVDHLRFVHLHVGGRHRSRRTMLVGVAIGIHYPKVVLGMLVQVFGRDTITARCGFACQGYVSLENLIRISANFDIGAIAVESLDSMRHPRPIVMRIIAIIATARSLVWTWSHDTYLVTVDTVGISVRSECSSSLQRSPAGRPALSFTRTRIASISLGDHRRRDGGIFQGFFDGVRRLWFQPGTRRATRQR